MARLIENIEPRFFRSCLVQGKWDESLRVLRKFGYPSPTTVRDLFYARTQIGDRTDILNIYGGHTNAFVVYPNGKDANKFFLIVNGKSNPLLRNPVNASDKENNGMAPISQRSLQYFLEKARDDSEKAAKTGTLFVRRDKLVSHISTRKFDNYLISEFLSQDQARPYTLYLKRNNIQEVPLKFIDAEYVQEQPKSFVCPLWIRGLQGDSGIDGIDRDLSDIDNLVLGVQFLNTKQSIKSLDYRI